jgi:hypothetical protein
MSDIARAGCRVSPERAKLTSPESAAERYPSPPSRSPAHVLLPPIALFGVYGVAQVIRTLGWIQADFGPFSFLDELLYRRDAESIFHGASYYSFHYPPLYPLLLSVAFFFRDHWYGAMLFINAIVSASVVFPVWWICRTFLTVRQSWFAVAIVLLLSYGFAFPPLLWSENLFIPLLCLAVYLGFCADPKRPGVHYSYGVTIASLWATRYIAVSLLPVFAASWLWRMHRTNRTRVGPGTRAQTIAFTGGFLTILVPWILYGRYSSRPLSAVLFGRYSLTQTSPSADLSSLALWVTAYFAYVFLAAAPVLPWAILELPSSRRSRESQLLWFTGLTVISLIVASTHHSWRHAYNYPEPFHLLGRYLTVAMPLVFCVGILALMRGTRAHHSPSRLRIGIAVAVSLGLVLLSRAILFGNLLRELRPDFARTSFNSPDTYGRDAWWTFVLMIVAVGTPLFLLLHRGAARFTARMVWFSATAAILLSCGIEVAQRTSEHGTVGRHARILARTWRELKIDHSKQTAIISGIPPSECTPNRLAVGGWFFGLPESVGVTNQYDCVAATSDFVLRVSAEPPAASPLATYTTFGRQYYVSVAQSQASRTIPCILSWGPTMTTVDTTFNAQPNGESAMWIKGRNFTPDTRVQFGSEILRPALSGSELLTFRVPRGLYEVPGRFAIRLFQAGSGFQSDPVWFLVRPE